MKKITALMGFFVLLAALVAGCGSGTKDDGDEVKLGEAFSLAIGQSAGIKGEALKVTFRDVRGDSRCPQGATCIRAGEVSVDVDFIKNGSAQSVVLTQPGLSDEYARATFEAYSITFKVLPYPRVNESITREQYRLTLIVDKLSKQKGVLTGHVTIGPLRPVERPGDPTDIPPEVYDARKVMVYDRSGKNLVKRVDIGHDGRYRVELPPGVYVVDINRLGIDRSREVPRTIEIRAGEVVTIDIDIDTGIR